MAGRTGWSGIIIFTKNPFSGFMDIHTVHTAITGGGKIGNTMFRLEIHFCLWMIRTKMTFSAVFRLAGGRCLKGVFAMTGITGTFGSI